MALAVPAARAAVKVAEKVPVVGGVLKGALEKSDPRKDAGRVASTLEAYNKAVGGDVAAALYVRQRTGKYGVVTIPGYGAVGGSGSDVGKDDAARKWSLLQSQPNGVAARAEALAANIRGGANAATLSSLTSPTVGGVPVWLLVLVVGVVLVMGYLVLTRRR